MADRLRFIHLSDPQPEDVFRPNLAAEIDDSRTWVDPNGYRLSDRLWRARAADRAGIERELRSSLANGEDALKTARRLEAYLYPDQAPRRNPVTGRILPKSQQPTGVTTRTPRNGLGSYAARRLARTETTRAFGKATMDAAARNPFVAGLKWVLSGRHPKPDECDQNAERHSRGLEAGEYKLTELPRYPNHPHCLCTLLQVLIKDVAKAVKKITEDVAKRAPEEFLSEPDAIPEHRVDIDNWHQSESDSFYAAYRSGARQSVGAGDFTEAENLALNYYKASGYGPMNRFLRDKEAYRKWKGITDLEEEAALQDKIDLIDSAFTKTRGLDSDIRVTRGSYTDFVGLEDAKPGDLFIDDGFVSTTARQEGVGFGRTLMMDIYIPKGTKVMALDNTLEGGEAEVLLNRGLVYRIHSVNAERGHVAMELLP